MHDIDIGECGWLVDGLEDFVPRSALTGRIKLPTDLPITNPATEASGLAVAAFPSLVLACTAL